MELFVSTQFWIRVVATSVACATFVFFLAIWQTTTTSTSGALVLLLCALHWHEFTRAANIMRLRWRVVLLSDTVATATRFAAIGVFFASGSWNLSAAILCVASGAILGAIVSPLGGVRLIGVPRSLCWRTFTDNLNFGKWLFAEGVVFALSLQVYLFIVFSFVEPAAAAALNAVQGLLGVVNVLLIGITNFATVTARDKLANEGRDAWAGWVSSLTWITGCIAASLCLVVSVWAESILTFVYSTSYKQYAGIVPILGITTTLGVINGMFSVAYRTAGFPQVGFQAKALSAVLACVCAIPLVKTMGLQGACVGLLLTQVCWCATYVLKMPTLRLCESQ